MKNELSESPRTFNVGPNEMKDFGTIELEPTEMVSVTTPDGKECDVTRHAWGFYLGSSLNERLAGEGFKTALVANPDGKVFVNAVESDKVVQFAKYLEQNRSRILCWLDKLDPEQVQQITELTTVSR